MITEFLDKRLERLEQLNTLRDLDLEEGRELAEIKRIKQLIIDSVSISALLVKAEQMQRENDKTQTEHWAFKVFDDALKNKQCIIDGVSQQREQCEEFCGMNHCDTNGCTERKRVLVEPKDIDEHCG